MAEAQPYVVVSLQPDPVARSLINLVIENLGATAAHRVTIEFDPPLTSTFDSDGSARIGEWTVLKSGIATLVPHQRFTHLIESLIARFGREDLSNRCTATIRYQGEAPDRREYEYAYELDFGAWYGSHYVGQKSLDDVAKAVEQMAGTLRDFRARAGGLHVAVFDGAEAEAELQRTHRARVKLPQNGGLEVEERPRGASAPGRRAPKSRSRS
ncbi:MAG TPA: hypothetical protein VNU19_03810 [Candidatus Acidoferrum sp.]|nr:hypothetical protein [Candidatus Acidoferrum sp.]